MSSPLAAYRQRLADGELQPDADQKRAAERLEQLAEQLARWQPGGWLRKAERLNPRFQACQRTLIAALAQSGDVEAARVSAGHLLSIEPSFRVARFTSWYPLRRRDDLDRFATGLLLAGVPK